MSEQCYKLTATPDSASMKEIVGFSLNDEINEVEIEFMVRLKLISEGGSNSGKKVWKRVGQGQEAEVESNWLSKQ